MDRIGREHAYQAGRGALEIDEVDAAAKEEPSLDELGALRDDIGTVRVEHGTGNEGVDVTRPPDADLGAALFGPGQWSDGQQSNDTDCPSVFHVCSPMMLFSARRRPPTLPTAEAKGNFYHVSTWL